MWSKRGRANIARTEQKETKRMKRNVCAGVLAALIVIGGSLALASGPPKLDPGLQPYQPTSGVSGSINSIGSDSLNNVMTLWAETFSKFYPNAKVQIEGKGSSTAPPALIAGTAQLGPMSRAMKGTEIDQFEKKYGYKPTQIRTSVDALGVFVNKENTLKNGDYKDTVKEQPGSASVVQGVTVDRFAVGYSGIGYVTAGVRPVPLAEKEGAQCYEADPDNAYSGNYPLSRFLYVYVNRAPGKPLDPLTREFVKLMLSREGQEVVVKDGYFPIPATIAKEELGKIQ